MNQFDDPDQAISIVAILFFVGAAFLLLPLLGTIFALSIFKLVLLAIGAGQVASGVGLLKTLRWAWPLAVAVAAIGATLGLLQMVGNIFNGLAQVAIAAFTLYLLFRPAVRQRFGTFR